jgi:hypothetical protein
MSNQEKITISIDLNVSSELMTNDSSATLVVRYTVLEAVQELLQASLESKGATSFDRILYVKSNIAMKPQEEDKPNEEIAAESIEQETIAESELTMNQLEELANDGQDSEVVLEQDQSVELEQKAEEGDSELTAEKEDAPVDEHVLARKEDAEDPKDKEPLNRKDAEEEPAKKELERPEGEEFQDKVVKSEPKDELATSEEVRALLNAEDAKDLCAMPLRIEGDELVVAIEDTKNHLLKNKIQLKVEKKVKFVQAEKEEILQAIEKEYASASNNSNEEVA